MNTSSNRRPVSIAFALTAAASVITVLTVGSPTASIASEPRGGQVTSDSSQDRLVRRPAGRPRRAVPGGVPVRPLGAGDRGRCVTVPEIDQHLDAGSHSSPASSCWLIPATTNPAGGRARSRATT